VADDGAQAAVEEGMIVAANRLNNAGIPAPLIAIQSHLRFLTDRAMGRTDRAAADLCNDMGYFFKQMIGYLEGARPYFERALAINEQVLGPIDPGTALSLNNLGWLLDAIGDYAAARPYYERALTIREQALGPTHHDTALSLNNLGALLRAQGDYAAARPYYERALAIREQTLGPTHPDTAQSLNNLAILLYDQHQLDQAVPLMERAVAICMERLGASHPDTKRTISSLEVMRQAAQPQGSAADPHATGAPRGAFAALRRLLAPKVKKRRG
jgi:tetratricopeptide (TPR) repeat protein